MRLLVVLMLATLSPAALGAELNLAVSSDGASTVIVDPGATVPFEVTAVLSDTDNEGLSYFIFDLSFDGGPLSPVAVPETAPLTHLAAPLGYGNAAGYGGTVVDGVLHQIGGSQNTLKLPDLGAVVTGIGHTPIVVASGTLTAPMSTGYYTVAVSEVLGRVISAGDDGSGAVWATEYAFDGDLQNLSIAVIGPCTTLSDCADLDGNGVRDNGCVWWACDAGTCASMEIAFADMGGFAGDCAPDGTADINDRFHVLNCFANQNTTGDGEYPCELAPPVAFNVDSAGLDTPCVPDGVCDGNDAFAVIDAFDGTSPCSCGGGPMPHVPITVVGKVTLDVRPRQVHVQPGDWLDVDVFLGSAVEQLVGYQLHLRSVGSRSGRLELVDMRLDPDKRSVFGIETPWMAFNRDRAQMLAGYDGAGIRAAAGAYLGTFHYRVPADASGTIVLELVVERGLSAVFLADPAKRVFVDSRPASIHVAGERRDATRGRSE